MGDFPLINQAMQIQTAIYVPLVKKIHFTT